jgi:proteic killer suppression protein
VPINISGKRSAKLIKGTKELSYPGLPHGLTATHADQVNADLLKFIKSVKNVARQPEFFAPDRVPGASSLPRHGSCLGSLSLVSHRLLPDRIVSLYTIRVIKSYRHQGLKRFAESGSKAGIQPKHADRLRRLLTALDVASVAQDMDAPGNKLHPLEGDLAHHWAVSVSGNWRLTFSFDGEDVIFVDYRDYH